MIFPWVDAYLLMLILFIKMLYVISDPFFHICFASRFDNIYLFGVLCGDASAGRMQYSQ